MGSTDVLIIGEGISALATAWSLSEYSVPVTLLTQDKARFSAPGVDVPQGILTWGEGLDQKACQDELLRASGANGYPRALEELVLLAGRVVDEVLGQGLDLSLDRDPSGELELKSLPGFNLAKTVGVGSSTSQLIYAALVKKVSESEWINVVSGVPTELITTAGHSCRAQDQFKKNSCLGVYALCDGEVSSILAKETILADDSYIDLFPTGQASTRHVGVKTALAHSAGAQCIDLDKIHFTPLGFIGSDGQTYRLDPDLLDLGGKLLSPTGQVLAETREDLECGDLSSTLALELCRSSADTLWLDLRSVGGSELREKAQTLVEMSSKLGIDVSQDPVPTVLVCDGASGGVLVDRFGNSSLKRLRFVGQGAVTGANAGLEMPELKNLEMLTLPLRLAEDVASQIKRYAYYSPPVKPLESNEEALSEAQLARHHAVLRHLMWFYVGFETSKADLQRVIHWIDQVEEEIPMCSVEAVQLCHALVTSKLVASARLHARNPVPECEPALV